MGRREVPVKKQENGGTKIPKHCAIEFRNICSLAARN